VAQSELPALLSPRELQARAAAELRGLQARAAVELREPIARELQARAAVAAWAVLPVRLNMRWQATL
jgi:hypothetical protein